MQFENGTDVHFMNEYVQVVSQNLDVIMKNSFLLQAKYNVLEKALNQRIGNDGQVNEQISSLAEERVQLLQRVHDISGEKQRIQDAFNAEMREHAQLKMNFSALEVEKTELLKQLKDALDKNKALNSEKNDAIQKLNDMNEAIVQKISENQKEEKPLKKQNISKAPKIEVKAGGTF